MFNTGFVGCPQGKYFLVCSIALKQFRDEVGVAGSGRVRLVLKKIGEGVIGGRCALRNGGR